MLDAQVPLVERMPPARDIADGDDIGAALGCTRGVAHHPVIQPQSGAAEPVSGRALSTWLGLSGIVACRGWVGWVSVVWVRLRQSVR